MAEYPPAWETIARRVILLGAGAVAIWGGFKTAVLGLYIPPPSSTQKYSSAVSSFLGRWMFLALLLVAFGAVVPLLFRYFGARVDPITGESHRPKENLWISIVVPVILAAVAVAIVFVTVARIDPLLEPFKPELAKLETFVAPPEWKLEYKFGIALFRPVATGRWEVPGTFVQACEAVEAAFSVWADDSTTSEVHDPLKNRFSPCRFEGRKGPHNIYAELYPNDERPMSVSLSVVRRAEVRLRDL